MFNRRPQIKTSCAQTGIKNFIPTTIDVMPRRLLQTLLILTYLHISLSFSATSFSGASFGHDTTDIQASSKTARGWSLQMPEVPLPKGAWYDDVSNPTARRISYDDGPYEFRFLAVGSTWSSFESDTSAVGTASGRHDDDDDDVNTSRLSSDKSSVSTTPRRGRRIGAPLRRARKWIRRRL